MNQSRIFDNQIAEEEKILTGFDIGLTLTNKQKKIAQITNVNHSLKRLARKHYAKLRLVNKELNSIFEIGNRLITTINVEEVLNIIVGYIPKLLNISGCFVRTVNEAGTELNVAANCGTCKNFQGKSISIKNEKGICCKVVRTGRPIVIADTSKDRRFMCPATCCSESMRSLIASPIIFKDTVLGVVVSFSRKANFFNKSDRDLLSLFAAHAAIALNNARMYGNIYSYAYNTILTLVKTVEAKDPYTRGHSDRVTAYAARLARKINLREKDVQLLVYAGKLHDIGKIAVPDFILRKTSALTLTEKIEMQAHPARGMEMLEPLKFLENCLPPIRHHHERYDGKGYPDGLKGKKIPLLARILAIADAFDAMISERPYRKSLDFDEALEEIKRNSRIQFDPLLAESFVALLREHPGIPAVDCSIAGSAELAS